MTHELVMASLHCLVMTDEKPHGELVTTQLCYEPAADWYRLSGSAFVHMVPLCAEHMVIMKADRLATEELLTEHRKQAARSTRWALVLVTLIPLSAIVYALIILAITSP